VTTGIKSFLLKPFDSFFRKNGVTVLPIKVTGTRGQPSFGLDFHRMKEDSKRRARRLKVLPRDRCMARCVCLGVSGEW